MAVVVVAGTPQVHVATQASQTGGWECGWHVLAVVYRLCEESASGWGLLRRSRHVTISVSGLWRRMRAELLEYAQSIAPQGTDWSKTPSKAALTSRSRRRSTYAFLSKRGSRISKGDSSRAGSSVGKQREASQTSGGETGGETPPQVPKKVHRPTPASQGGRPTSLRYTQEGFPHYRKKQQRP